jgi:hypothetical protein
MARRWPPSPVQEVSMSWTIARDEAKSQLIAPAMIASSSQQKTRRFRRVSI